MIFFKFIRDSILDFLFPMNNVYSACKQMSLKTFSELLHVHESDTPIHTATLFRYRDKEVQTLIKGFKYYGYREAAHIFGVYMSEYLIEELSDEEKLGSFVNPVIIPVPVTQSKKIERGYNQSALLAKEIYRHLHKAASMEIAYDVLKRIGSAPAQAHSDKSERRHNVAEQFVTLQKGKIKGRNVLLIDDVITTGSTLKEASDSLLKAGAKEVRALVVAH